MNLHELYVQSLLSSKGMNPACLTLYGCTLQTQFTSLGFPFKNIKCM